MHESFAFYGKDHDGYCSGPDEEVEVDNYYEYIYELPNNTTIIHRQILNKKIKHYMDCSESFYRVLSVTYIKDKAEHLTKEEYVTLKDKDQLIREFGESKDNLENNYPIKIICEICSTKSIITGDIFYCKGCHC